MLWSVPISKRRALHHIFPFNRVLQPYGWMMLHISHCRIGHPTSDKPFLSRRSRPFHAHILCAGLTRRSVGALGTCSSALPVKNRIKLPHSWLLNSRLSAVPFLKSVPYVAASFFCFPPRRSLWGRLRFYWPRGRPTDS